MRSSQGNPELLLIVAPEAQLDIFDILQYTLEEWGHPQAKKYKGIIDKALLDIWHNPQLGHKRPDVPPDYRAYPAGQHVIIFRVEVKRVYVVRVLHGRMDFSPRFTGED